MLRKGELIFILAIVAIVIVSLARLRLFARLPWRLNSFSWRSLCSLCSTMSEPRRRFGDGHHVSEKLCGKQASKKD